MPSDSIAGFLENAQASRVLFPEQVEQLIRQPDIPQSDLSALCSYLLERGVLTKFQADAIREGRGGDLNFAGYPVIDEIGPCPGGMAYKALHPSLRTPLILRRFTSESFGPSDTTEAFVNRARTIGSITHPHILPLLDAGIHQEQAYAVLDRPMDAADLEALLKEVGGAMPGFLAAEYGRAIASALRVIHERGGWHGEVRPSVLLVGPLTTKTSADGQTKRRPAPNATVKLTETGLIPIRPAATLHPLAPEVLSYLPPERVDASIYSARGDIYSLGATLYLLLAGRPPFAAPTSDELLNKVRSAEPLPLGSMRPDVSTELAAVVMKMLAKRLEDRLETAADVEAALVPFCRPETVPTPDSKPGPALVAVAVAVPVAEEFPVDSPALDLEPDDWGVDANAFAVAQAASVADTSQPRRRTMTDEDKSRSTMWIVVGAMLHLLAVGLLIAWALGAFTPSPEEEPAPKQKQPQQQGK
ncbi:MAG: serine/threonine protein kinase [Planctomycetia bacterium]|nr:serine/threonine protein kinase [Planctomycetia bacterium]